MSTFYTPRRRRCALHMELIDEQCVGRRWPCQCSRNWHRPSRPLARRAGIHRGVMSVQDKEWPRGVFGHRTAARGRKRVPGRRPEHRGAREDPDDAVQRMDAAGRGAGEPILGAEDAGIEPRAGAGGPVMGPDVPLRERSRGPRASVRLARTNRIPGQGRMERAPRASQV